MSQWAPASGINLEHHRRFRITLNCFEYTSTMLQANHSFGSVGVRDSIENGRCTFSLQYILHPRATSLLAALRASERWKNHRFINSTVWFFHFPIYLPPILVLPIYNFGMIPAISLLHGLFRRAASYAQPTDVSLCSMLRESKHISPTNLTSPHRSKRFPASRGGSPINRMLVSVDVILICFIWLPSIHRFFNRLTSRVSTR